MTDVNSTLLEEASKLSVEERIQLAEAIWDTVAAEAASVPVPDSHKTELDRRLADLSENPDAGSPWEEVRDRLERSR